MQLLKDNEKSKSTQFFKDLTTTTGRRSLFKNVKRAFTENKFIQNMSIAGFVAAAFQAVTFHSVTLLGIIPIVQIIGQLVAAFALNNALRDNVPIQSKTNSDVNVHLIKSIIVVLMGVVSTALVSALPFSTIFTYFTTILTFAGIGGIIESGIEKYRRNS